MSEQEAGTVQSTHPDITKNLMWEDVQIGLREHRTGLMILVLSAIVGPFFLASFFVYLGILIGGFLTLHGILASVEVPKESNARFPIIAASGCTLVSFLVAVGHFLFISETSDLLTLTTVVLAAMAYILVTYAILNIAAYLNAVNLENFASKYILLATLIAAVVVAIYLFKGTEFLMTVAQVLILVASVLQFAVAGQAATVIETLRRGEALEEAPAPAEEDVDTEYVSITDVPPEDVYATINHPAPHTAFVDNEWRALERDDRATAKVFVGLITGIFCIGVVIYTIVLCTVAM